MRILTTLAAFFFIACEEPDGSSDDTASEGTADTEAIFDLPDGGMITLDAESAAHFAPQGDEERREVQLDPMELRGTRGSGDDEEGDRLMMSGRKSQEPVICVYQNGNLVECSDVP